MSHYSDDELALYFYGEANRPEAIRDHLDHCAGCAANYSELAATLKLVTAPPIPERDERYGLEVWQRIRPQLPVAPPAVLPLWRRHVYSMAGLAAAAVLVADATGHDPSRAVAVAEQFELREIVAADRRIRRDIGGRALRRGA